MTALRCLWAFTRWAVIGAVVAVAVAFLAVTFTGHRSYTVMSGSMRPAIDIGDIVVNRPIRPRDAHIGDVVTFKDPTRDGHLITHRVVSLAARGPDVAVVTRGDANTGTEHWSVPAGGRIGRVIIDVPRAGFVMAWLHRPKALLLVIVLPALVLAAFEIRAIWRKEPELAARQEVPA